MRPRHHQFALPTVLFTAFFALQSTASRADAISALNMARQGSCAARGILPLQRSSRLDAVAWRLAHGESLHEALLAAAYRVSAATSIHVIGTNSDQATAQTLTEHYCHNIADATLREVGVAERGAQLWLVIAAPVRPPSPQQARIVSQRVLELVNEARARNRRCGEQRYAAVPPLQLASPLNVAALEHSQDMAWHSEFEHTGHDGSKPSDRVKRTGYQPRVVGENIAAGMETPEEAVAGWLASPDHCVNIMNARYTDMGVGYATNLNSALVTYWTQEFAAPR